MSYFEKKISNIVMFKSKDKTKHIYKWILNVLYNTILKH